jgi:hypothetical protein
MLRPNGVPHGKPGQAGWQDKLDCGNPGQGNKGSAEWQSLFLLAVV